MKRGLILAGFALTALVAHTVAAEATFVPAPDDPLVGDWCAVDGTLVAQLSLDVHQDYQLQLAPDFDGGATAIRATLRGQRRDDGLTLRGDGWRARLGEDRRLSVEGEGRNLTLERVARANPTLGQPPPAGALVLFSGTSLDGWSRKDGKNWLTPRGPPEWRLVDGAMEVVPGTDSLISSRSFGDCTLHLEFRLLGTPTNSGVYLQARYEVDLNASYGRVEGHPCGNLGNCSDVPPATNASRAPREWQVLDVEFRAPRFDAAGRKTEPARATVRLNGVILYADQPLNSPKGAAGRLGEAAVGPLLLQEHGAPLQFRNIWILPAQ